MNKLRQSVILLILSFTLLIANSASAAKSKIGVLVFDGFIMSDVTAPIEVFGAAKKKAWFSSYEIVVISVAKNREVLSDGGGLRIIADKSIYDDIKLDVLIVPSAYEMDVFVKNKDLIQYIKRQSKSASWMASNCAGAFLLAEAGVLDGKKATTWFGGEKGLSKAYPKIKVQYDKTVVVDSKVITSNGGPVSYQAAFKLLAKLSSEKLAKEISEEIQFNRLENAFKP